MGIVGSRSAVSRRRPPAAVFALFRDEPHQDLDGSLAAFLIEREMFDFALAEGAQLWRLHCERLLASWTEDHPGTRPGCWWCWDAPRMPAGRWQGFWFDGQLPEPRRRLGGVGVPAHEVSAYFPHCRLGIPVHWATISAKNPPRFEGQASYLKRHGLFLPGEERRLTAADFAPEPVPVEEVDANPHTGVGSE